MKKFSVIVCIALVSMFVSGCMTHSNNLPGTGAPLGEIGTTATYDIIGDAVGTASGGTLLGFISIGVEPKNGQIAGGYPILNPIASAAVFNAIESVPSADAIMAPRFSTKTKNFVIFSESTVTVKGKAIRYNPSAK